MIPGIAEYVVLRLARRFLFSDAFLVRFGRFVPYYRTNANQADAGPVVDKYADALSRSGGPLQADRVILEIGSGATNSVGYELIRRQMAGTAGRIYLYEPYVPLDPEAEATLRKGSDSEGPRVDRITSLDEVAGHYVDLVLSNSVLEHVKDPHGLLTSLERVLHPSGRMIHVVDYRDHFFKYPYHFLTFGTRVWERWLDPGDLPRWRLGGHLKAFSEHRFETQVLDHRALQDEFDAIRTSISPDFDADDPATAVTSAILLSTPNRGGSRAEPVR